MQEFKTLDQVVGTTSNFSPLETAALTPVEKVPQERPEINPVVKKYMQDYNVELDQDSAQRYSGFLNWMNETHLASQYRSAKWRIGRVANKLELSPEKKSSVRKSLERAYVSVQEDSLFLYAILTKDMKIRMQLKPGEAMVDEFVNRGNISKMAATRTEKQMYDDKRLYKVANRRASQSKWFMTYRQLFDVVASHDDVRNAQEIPDGADPFTYEKNVGGLYHHGGQSRVSAVATPHSSVKYGSITRFVSRRGPHL